MGASIGSSGSMQVAMGKSAGVVTATGVSASVSQSGGNALQQMLLQPAEYNAAMQGAVSTVDELVA